MRSLWRVAGLVALALLGAAPAGATRTPWRTVAGFDRFLTNLPDGDMQLIPDPNPGRLYGGRVAGTSTIVRVFPRGPAIAREKVEIAIHAEEHDQVALRLLARFLDDFLGLPTTNRLIDQQLFALRGQLVSTGHRYASTRLLNTEITLSFDNSPGELVRVLDDQRQDWTYLFWRADARRIR